MTGDRISTLVSAIERRYPGSRVAVRSHTDEEDPAIRWFLWVLNVPRPRLTEVEDFAIDLAIRLHGADPLSCYVSAVSPENTAKHFAEVSSGLPGSGPKREEWFAGFVVDPRYLVVESFPAVAGSVRLETFFAGFPADLWWLQPQVEWTSLGRDALLSPAPFEGSDLPDDLRTSFFGDEIRSAA